MIIANITTSKSVAKQLLLEDGRYSFCFAAFFRLQIILLLRIQAAAKSILELAHNNNFVVVEGYH